MHHQSEQRARGCFSGVILTSLRTCARPAGAGPVRHLHALHRSLPDRCDSRALSTRFQPMHLLSHNRKTRIDRRKIFARDGPHVFGCDICQDVCPWNRKAPASTAPEFEPRPGLVNPALAWLAEMSAEEFREIFRGSPDPAHQTRPVSAAMLPSPWATAETRNSLPVLDQTGRRRGRNRVAESAVWARTAVIDDQRIT